jgi:hypothetical protein
MMYGPYSLQEWLWMAWQALAPILALLTLYVHLGYRAHRRCGALRPWCPCQIVAPSLSEEWRRCTK